MGNFDTFKWWMWPAYGFGWLTGWANLIFWGVHLFAYYSGEHDRFFGPAFHRRVAYWGIAVAVFFGLFISYAAATGW